MSILIYHGGLINPERELRLLSVIKQVQNYIPKYELSVLFLYYDGDNGIDDVKELDLLNDLSESFSLVESFQEKLVI